MAGNKKGTTSSADNDCTGTITSQDYNLTGSGTGCSLSGTYDASVTPSTVFSALLGALADNGGQTYTHALIAGTAAVDAIPNGTNGCGSGSFALDQHGAARPYNGSCDIGAYEKYPLSVSTTGTDSGNCTVSDCLTLAYAYGKASSGDTINLAAGTFTETTDFNIANTITITGVGAGSTIVQQAAEAGTASHRFFKVSSGATAVVQDLTLRHGVEASGGAINIQSGTLTLNRVALSDNQVKNIGATLNGGAISINAGTLTINDSTLSNNSIADTDSSSSHGNGGAIYTSASGNVTLNNVTLSGNSAKRGGGAIYGNGGTVNVYYSTLADNTADSDADGDGEGGGIRRNGGTINLKGSILAGNKKGSGTDSDCSGTTGINSSGYNLTGSGTGCSLSGTGDTTVAPATVFTSLLGALASNGGTTDTHQLYGGNAAQDAIPSGTIDCGTSPFNQDQRGSGRPYNSSCDMGAYESQDARPSVAMSTSAGSSTTTSPIPVTVAFSESVTGFTAGDVTAGNASVGNFSGSGASYSFDLTPAGDGTVTADIAAGVAQDSVYNYNTEASQLSIVYDGTAPTVTGFAATSPSTSLAIPITSFTATDTLGVVGYLITTSSTAPSAGDAGWTASAPTTYTVGSDGSYTLYPWAKDSAGNVSSAYGSPAGVTVDTTAPDVTDFSAASSSSSLSIPITAFTASDSVGVTGYLITTSSTPPSAATGDWTATAPTAFTAAASGSYTLYPWAKDTAGNVSAVYGSPAGVTVYAYTLSGEATVSEGNSGTQSVTLTVTRSETLSSASVDLSIAGTATAGRDYTGPTVSGSGAALSGSTLQFDAGTASASLRFDVAGDTVYEGTESILVGLANTGDAAVSGSPQTITINDDDTQPSWTIQASPSEIVEGDGSDTKAKFIVTLTGSTELPVSVAYATANGSAQAGSDFTAASGTIQIATTWNAGAQAHTSSTSQTIEVPVTGDTATEGDENFSLGLSSPTSSTLLTASAQATLIDDESYSDRVCGADSLFYSTTYTGTFYCSATTRIRAGWAMAVASGATVVYSAPTVQLESGTTISNGGYFHAGQNLSSPARPALDAGTATQTARQSARRADPLAAPAPLTAARRLSPEELPVGLRNWLSGAGGSLEEFEPFFGDSAGNWIVFATDAPLLADDANEVGDVYAYRAAEDELVLLSRTPAGRAGNGASGWPAIDGAGERVVFQSLASDLVAGDESGFQDIFAYDLPSGELQNLTLGAEAPSAHPALDGSGAWVLFDQGTEGDRMIRQADAALGETTAVPFSLGTDDHHPAVSGDGRFEVWIEGTDSLRYRDNTRALELALPYPPQLAPFAEEARPLFGPDGGWVEWVVSGRQIRLVTDNPLD